MVDICMPNHVLFRLIRTTKETGFMMTLVTEQETLGVGVYR